MPFARRVPRPVESEQSSSIGGLCLATPCSCFECSLMVGILSGPEVREQPLRTRLAKLKLIFLKRTSKFLCSSCPDSAHPKLGCTHLITEPNLPIKYLKAVPLYFSDVKIDITCPQWRFSRWWNTALLASCRKFVSFSHVGKLAKNASAFSSLSSTKTAWKRRASAGKNP